MELFFAFFAGRLENVSDDTGNVHYESLIKIKCNQI